MIRIQHLAVVAFLLCPLSGMLLHAQQTASPNSGGTDPNGSPIDVPDIIIKGSATIKLMATSFSKQMPSATRPLRGSELDSLNPLEKQSPSLLSLSPTNAQLWQYQPRSTSVLVHMGIFQTPEFAASYGTAMGDYALFAKAQYESSHGYATNTDFSNLGAYVDLRHREPEGEGLFAGGLSKASIALRNTSYKFFGMVDSVPQRRLQSVALNVQSDNQSNSLPYVAYAGISSSTIRDDAFLNKSSTELAIRAGLDLSTHWTSFDPGAYVHLDLRPTAGTTLSLTEVGISSTIGDSAQHVDIRAGIQAATDSHAQTNNEIALRAAYHRQIGDHSEASIAIGRHLDPLFLSDQVTENPYLSAASDLLPEKTSFNVDGMFRSMPSRELEWSAGVRFASLSQEACTQRDSSRQLVLVYQSTSLFSLHTESIWHPNSSSSLSAQITYTSATLSNGHATPYVAPIAVDLRYHCRIGERWSAEILASYLGARNLRIDADTSVSGYFLLNAALHYEIVNGLSVSAYVENITNSSIFVYEAYKARGAFASVGFEWKF